MGYVWLGTASIYPTCLNLEDSSKRVKEHSSRAYFQHSLLTERELRRLNTTMVERTNEGHDEHGGSSEADHGAHWRRERVELDPDGMDGEVVAMGWT